MELCVHRLDLGLYSHPKEFCLLFGVCLFVCCFFFGGGGGGGVDSEPMLTPREDPLYRKKFSLGEDGTHDAASSRTASPTHYQRAIPAPKEPIKDIAISILKATCQRQMEKKISNHLSLHSSLSSGGQGPVSWRPTTVK